MPLLIALVALNVVILVPLSLVLRDVKATPAEDFDAAGTWTKRRWVVVITVIGLTPAAIYWFRVRPRVRARHLRPASRGRLPEDVGALR